MSERFLIDTDIMIDFFRERSGSVNFLRNAPIPVYLSVISIGELYAGVRDGRERGILEKTLAAFDILPVDFETAKKGGLFRRDYGKSHGVGLADALIAATAVTHGLTLVTLNKKHYPMMSGAITVPYKKPG